jgi:hypothetical protein
VAILSQDRLQNTTPGYHLGNQRKSPFPSDLPSADIKIFEQSTDCTMADRNPAFDEVSEWAHCPFDAHAQRPRVRRRVFFGVYKPMADDEVVKAVSDFEV